MPPWVAKQNNRNSLACLRNASSYSGVKYSMHIRRNCKRSSHGIVFSKNPVYSFVLIFSGRQATALGQPESYPPHRLQARFAKSIPRTKPSALHCDLHAHPKAYIPATSINCHPPKAKSCMPLGLCGRPIESIQGAAATILALALDALFGPDARPQPGTLYTGFG